MSLKIQDQATAAALAQATGAEIEVTDGEGRVLGHFTPAPRPGMSCPELGVTDEELDRRLNDPDAKWVTGDEVMARLRALRRA